MIKQKEEIVKNKCKEKNYQLIEPYIHKNNKSKIKLKCNIDGHEWEPTYYWFINKDGSCPRCVGQVLYIEEAINNINEKLIKINSSLIEPFVYKNNKSILKLICNIDGHVRNLTYHNFIHNNNGCPRCSKKILYKNEIQLNINKRLNDINATLIEPYIHKNNKSKLKLKCNIDGYEWESTYINFVNNNRGCAKCAGVLKLNNIDVFNNINIRLIEINATLIGHYNYLNNNTKLKLKCNIDDYEWEVSYYNLIHKKSGCPKCNISKGEQKIENYLKENNIKYTLQKSFDDCKFKSKLKFDFYLPEKNICIEYDGIQHFKSFDFFGGEKSLKNTEKRDEIKNKYCKDKNIKLIRIPYYDFNKIEEIIKNCVILSHH